VELLEREQEREREFGGWNLEFGIWKLEIGGWKLEVRVSGIDILN
jgi:hypothetical protein